MYELIAKELIKNGKRRAAHKLMQEWNKGLNAQIRKFNEKFKKYNIQDKGGLKKSYFFTPLKKKYILKKKAGKGRDYLEERLRKR